MQVVSFWCGVTWSQWPGLNRRPTVYETVALPLSYIGLSCSHFGSDLMSTDKPKGQMSKAAKWPKLYNRSYPSGQVGCVVDRAPPSFECSRPSKLPKTNSG